MLIKSHSSTQSQPGLGLSHPFLKTPHLGEAKVGRTSQVNFSGWYISEYTRYLLSLVLLLSPSTGLRNKVGLLI